MLLHGFIDRHAGKSEREREKRRNKNHVPHTSSPLLAPTYSSPALTSNPTSSLTLLFQSASHVSSAPDPATKMRAGFLRRNFDCAALKTSVRMEQGEVGSVLALGGRRSGDRWDWLVFRAMVRRVGGIFGCL